MKKDKKKKKTKIKEKKCKRCKNKGYIIREGKMIACPRCVNTQRNIWVDKGW